MTVIRWVLLGIIAGCVFVGCSGVGEDHRSPALNDSGAQLPSTETELPVVVPYEIPLPTSMPVPDGVEADVWKLLTSELERQLVELRGASRVGDVLVLRTVSTPPQTLRSGTLLVKTATDLVWGYYSSGDYDQNSEVNLADLAQLALHYMESALPFKFPINSIQAVIDGDYNGEINLADITPIALNFQNNVEKYNLYRSKDIGDYPDAHGDTNGGAERIASVLLGSADGDRGKERLQLSTIPPDDLKADYMWVRPVDNEGIEGIASNLAGPFTNIFTLDGYVFMAGGGTDPLPGVPIGLSGDATASTVTDDSGYYSFDGLPAGNYTITPSGDPYGYAPENIEATITNADKYLSPIYPAPVDIVHTWTTDRDSGVDGHVMGLDGQNNVYLAGHAYYDDFEFLFVVKYDMFGNLQWERTKDFGYSQQNVKGHFFPNDMLIDTQGNIYICGSYTTAPDDTLNIRYRDVFILKLKSSGEEMWMFSYTSPTPHSTSELQDHSDSSTGMDFDTQGNLVLLGEANSMDGFPIFQLKVSPNGELLEDRYFTLETDEFFDLSLQDVEVDSLGNIFSSGMLASPAPPGIPSRYPAMLMKTTPEGQVSWLNYWGSEFVNCSTTSIKFDLDGSLYATSKVVRVQGELRDTHLARITPQGGVSWEVQISSGTNLSNPFLAIGPQGNLWIGQSESFPSENPFRTQNSVPYLLSFDPNGNFRFVRRWYEVMSEYTHHISGFGVNEFGVVVLGGNTGNILGEWETPIVALDNPQSIQSTQMLIPYGVLGEADAAPVSEVGIVGEEDNRDNLKQALIMFYRP